MTNETAGSAIEVAELKTMLEEFLLKCLISFNSIEVETEGEDTVRMNIMTDEPAFIIGKHAETLFSLQQLFRLITRRKLDTGQRVIIDVDNYRRSQESTAQSVAQDAARRARESGLPQELMPMPSYKRRAVHTMFLQPEFKDFKVYSVGEGEERRIRLEPIKSA